MGLQKNSNNETIQCRPTNQLPSHLVANGKFSHKFYIPLNSIFLTLFTPKNDEGNIPTFHSWEATSKTLIINSHMTHIPLELKIP